MGSRGVPEESLLRHVRLIKSGGLKANPQFAVKFNKPDIPTGGHRAFGAHAPPAPRSTGKEAAPVLVFDCYGYTCLKMERNESSMMTDELRNMVYS